MDQKTMLETLTMGSLLHDVGKIIRRSSQSGYLDHSTEGANFLKSEVFDITEKEAVIQCVKYHHYSHLKGADIKKDNPAYIVYEADNISAGSDRRKIEEDQKKYPFDPRLPLKPVFPLLKRTGEKEKNAGYAYYLRSLKEENGINYPFHSGIKATADKYDQRLSDIEEAFKTHWKKCSTYSANSILQILEATASFIPSSTCTGEEADISLYDHSKLTAAIAGCIYLYLTETEKTNDFRKYCFEKNTENRNKPCYLLVSGDISGIQNFIYTVASDKASKALRGRSFFLEILLEHIADEILETLGLSRANLLYTGGGHFYMLLPNTEKAKSILTSAEKKVNDWFIENFGTLLYLASGWTECSSIDLMGRQDKKDKNNHHNKNSDVDNNLLSAVFEKTSHQLSVKKQRRYDKEQLEMLMNPDSNYNSKTDDNSRECASCRTTARVITDKEGSVCVNCRRFQNAGQKILTDKFNTKLKKYSADRQTVMPVISKSEPYPDDNDRCLSLPSLDENFKYLDFVERSKLNDYYRVYSKNRWMEGENLSTNLWVGDYSKLSQNEKNKGIITFEELARKGADERELGVTRLAVLRADVDNLGTAFSSGLPPAKQTLSRTAVLSRQLGMFFKMHINKICKEELDGEGDVKVARFRLNPFDEKQDKEKYLLVVYSGGDDVFVAGAWDDVIDFAVDMRKAFHKFTCGKLTFSAGIGFFSPSFPVSQMAELTGRLESRAKNHRKEKDSLALFGEDEYLIQDRSDKTKVEVVAFNHVYSWEDFTGCGFDCESYDDAGKEAGYKGIYGKILFFRDNFWFEGYENQDKSKKLFASRAFLYRLLSLLKGQKKDSLNLARLAYALARMEPENGSEKTECFENIKKKLYSWAQKEDDANQLITAINLLVYMTREEKH